MTPHRSALINLAALIILLLTACQPASSAPPTSTPRPPMPPTLAPPAAALLLLSATPALTASLATGAAPTQLSTLPPGPTLVPDLLHRVPDEIIPSPPDGLEMAVYKLALPPFADEGYGPVIRFLGNQSWTSKLTQGRYYRDTADLALLEADNTALAPFGYRLESQPVTAATGARWYTLYQGEKIILDPIYTLSPISVNRSGTDFLLLVEGNNDLGLGSFLLIRKASIEPWKTSNSNLSTSRPQFLGDDPMHVQTRPNTPAAPDKTPEAPNAIADVFRGDKVIYSIPYQDRQVASGLIGFWTYGEHWALETADRLVIDGQDLNLQNGYTKSFEFHLLGGNPLFFYEKAASLGVSYNGKTAPLPFPAIPHYGCCSAGANNPMQIGDVLIFYGLQGDSYFYIEMTAKPYSGP